MYGQKRRQAVLALSAKPIGSTGETGEAPGYDTNRDTKQDVVNVPKPEVICERLEPQTSTVSKRLYYSGRGWGFLGGVCE
jgi:hypothetical protein